MPGAKSEPLLHPRPWSTSEKPQGSSEENKFCEGGSPNIAVICFQSSLLLSLSLAIISIWLQSPTAATVDSLRFRADFPRAAQEMVWMLAFGVVQAPHSSTGLDPRQYSARWLLAKEITSLPGVIFELWR